MDGHVMTSESAVRILGALQEHGVDGRVGGGWAVDALLGKQTREHSDLDLWLPASDLEPLFVAMAGCGIDRILPWPGDRPWNFVLYDGARLRVDLHLFEPLADGSLHYGGFVDGEVFPAAALDGRGTIADLGVRCDAPEWALRWHTGYPPRAVDRHDVMRLCDRFGLALPDGYRSE